VKPTISELAAPDTSVELGLQAEQRFLTNVRQLSLRATTARAGLVG